MRPKSRKEKRVAGSSIADFGFGVSDLKEKPEGKALGFF
jgi:hypothetical protein